MALETSIEDDKPGDIHLDASTGEAWMFYKTEGWKRAPEFDQPRFAPTIETQQEKPMNDSPDTELEFKVGDRVFVDSTQNTPTMIVDSIVKPSNGLGVPLSARCYWFDVNGHVQRADFPLRILTKDTGRIRV